MEATNKTGKNLAGAQSRGAEGGTNLSVRLATWRNGFDGFIGECEDLQQELEQHDPYNAAADGERVQLLIEIAKRWHGG